MRGVRSCPAVALLAVLLIVGCGGGPASVAGKVTSGGKPVVRGSVVFLTAANQAVSAEIQPDGSYQISEMPAGPVKVAVSSPEQPGASNEKGGRVMPGARREKASAGPTTGWFPIPGKYSDPDNSGLNTTLNPGANIYDIKVD